MVLIMSHNVVTVSCQLLAALVSTMLVQICGQWFMAQSTVLHCSWFGARMARGKRMLDVCISFGAERSTAL